MQQESDERLTVFDRQQVHLNYFVNGEPNGPLTDASDISDPPPKIPGRI